MRPADQRIFALNEWTIIWPIAGDDQKQNRRHYFRFTTFCQCESTENARDDIVILLLTRPERSRSGDVMAAGS